jgi:tetratricopeptide (TPR) repeat protein
MKRKFEALRENLDEFVSQNDYPVLVVGCLSDELAYVAKFLQSLDEKHPADFFVVFAQPFPSAGAYMDAVVAALKVQLQAAAEARQQRGESPFPALPDAIGDRRRPADARLRDLLEYLRTLLPDEREHRMVVGLLPLQCADVDGYALFVGSLFPQLDFPEWMRALRVVVYDDRSQKRIAADLQARKIERVLSFDVDFSTPALTNALSVDAADTSLPVAERMGALLQLAALDYSYKRYPDAIEKYGLLYRYYEGVGLPSMGALCLIGAGDVLHASGKPVESKEMLQRGIALGLEHKALAMVLNGLLSIVEVCFALGHLEDAESYSDSGAKVAAAALNPVPYADLLERKGDAQMAQGRRDDAMASYAKCRDIARMYGHTPRLESVLDKLVGLYGSAGMFSEQHDASSELARVRAGEAPLPPRPVGQAAPVS